MSKTTLLRQDLDQMADPISIAVFEDLPPEEKSSFDIFEEAIKLKEAKARVLLWKRDKAVKKKQSKPKGASQPSHKRKAGPLIGGFAKRVCAKHTGSASPAAAGSGAAAKPAPAAATAKPAPALQAPARAAANPAPAMPAPAPAAPAPVAERVPRQPDTFSWGSSTAPFKFDFTRRKVKGEVTGGWQCVCHVHEKSTSTRAGSHRLMACSREYPAKDGTDEEHIINALKQRRAACEGVVLQQVLKGGLNKM